MSHIKKIDFHLSIVKFIFSGPRDELIFFETVYIVYVVRLDMLTDFQTLCLCVDMF